MDINTLKSFARPFYKNKDIMHDISHIERVLVTLDSLLVDINESYNYEIIVYAAYLHGFIYSDEGIIKGWLRKEGFDESRIEKILKVAWESQKNEEAETIEGRLLHDAHMIEGGKVFLVIKSLITGSVRGQTLEQTIEYIEKNILDRGKCYYKRAQQIYKDSQEFAKYLIQQMREGLKGNI
jgi:uncharacterized protein